MQQELKIAGAVTRRKGSLYRGSQADKVGEIFKDKQNSKKLFHYHKFIRSRSSAPLSSELVSLLLLHPYSKACGLGGSPISRMAHGRIWTENRCTTKCQWSGLSDQEATDNGAMIISRVDKTLCAFLGLQSFKQDECIPLPLNHVRGNLVRLFDGEKLPQSQSWPNTQTQAIMSNASTTKPPNEPS